MTQHTNLNGSAFIAASQAGYDRAARQFGEPTLHIQDKIDATNFVYHRARVFEGEEVGPRALIAAELAQASLALLRCAPGQELSVLASASASIAVLASRFTVPQEETKPEAPRGAITPPPTAHTTEMNKTLEPRTLPPQTSRPALISNETAKV